ncbi:MAG: teichoic acid biosynthesis protein RodC-like protein [Firmicutes bacterium]|nr:teichoic acid biosynthesis protein RodC-like protein [Bacillota bacterium]
MGFIKKIIWFFLYGINCIIPKKRTRILFHSEPSFSDNAKALWEYIDINFKYETIWIVDDDDLYHKMKQKGIGVYHNNTFLGFWKIFRSKYLVTTHVPVFIKVKANNQILINLWHGVPLKCMGFLDKTESKKALVHTKFFSDKTDFFITTSAIMKYALISCFYINPSKVLVLGQPRNDKILSLNYKVDLLENLLQVSINNYNKVLLYVPTFRVGYGQRVEGEKIDIVGCNYMRLKKFDYEKFESFLKENNYLLVMKLHPIEEKYYKESIEAANSSHIKFLWTQDMQENMCFLYDFLNLFDVLITDYSSVFYDYLLCNRPLVFLDNDIEEYKSVRGLIFDDPYFWMPGYKVKSLLDLQKALVQCFSNDIYIDKRMKINKLVNLYQDDQASQRISKLFS